MGHVGATGKTPCPVAPPWCHLEGLGNNLISSKTPIVHDVCYATFFSVGRSWYPRVASGLNQRPG